MDKPKMVPVEREVLERWLEMLLVGDPDTEELEGVVSKIRLELRALLTPPAPEVVVEERHREWVSAIIGAWEEKPGAVGFAGGAFDDACQRLATLEAEREEK